MDSTRRGKRFPDALSKTVPIWCAVINDIIFGDGTVVCPMQSVSAQEVSSIESLIPSFVRSIKKVGVDISLLEGLLDKPLRPVFVSPDTQLERFTLEEDCYPVILVCASNSVFQRTDEYVQGAADDEEAWSHGITSSLFWQYHEKFLSCYTEEQLFDFLHSIPYSRIPDRTMSNTTQILSTNLFLGVGMSSYDKALRIHCDTHSVQFTSSSRIETITIPQNIKPLRVLTQHIFPAAISLVDLRTTSLTILATDISASSIDISTSIALILLCLFYDDNGTWYDQRGHEFTKDIIRRRLNWITMARGHQAERVSRQILKIVNTYLMGRSPPPLRNV